MQDNKAALVSAATMLRGQIERVKVAVSEMETCQKMIMMQLEVPDEADTEHTIDSEWVTTARGKILTMLSNIHDGAVVFALPSLIGMLKHKPEVSKALSDLVEKGEVERKGNKVVLVQKKVGLENR